MARTTSGAGSRNHDRSGGYPTPAELAADLEHYRLRLRLNPDDAALALWVRHLETLLAEPVAVEAA